MILSYVFKSVISEQILSEFKHNSDVNWFDLDCLDPLFDEIES
jgi:hypothetical protein